MENLQMEQIAPESNASSDSIENVQNVSQESDNKSANSYGRFKTSDELVKAYTNLEKEFTKRSQRLKVVEREIDTKKTETSDSQYSQKNWQERVNNFLTENPVAKPFKKQLSKAIMENDLSANPNCLELALAKVLVKNYQTPASLIDDTEFLDNHIFSNEKIRNKIIKDYLCKVSDIRSPKTIGGGGQPVLTPPTRPHNFGEAGEMAVMLSKKGAK